MQIDMKRIRRDVRRRDRLRTEHRRHMWERYAVDEPGKIELSFGPGWVSAGFVDGLREDGAYNIRIRFGHFWSREYDEHPLADVDDSFWEEVERVYQMWGRDGIKDERGFQKQITLHATMPRGKFEAHYRNFPGPHTLPKWQEEFLKRLLKKAKG